MSLIDRIRALTPEERRTYAVGLVGLLGAGLAYAAGRKSGAEEAPAFARGFESGRLRGRTESYEEAIDFSHKLASELENDKQKAAAAKAKYDRMMADALQDEEDANARDDAAPMDATWAQ